MKRPRLTSKFMIAVIVVAIFAGMVLLDTDKKMVMVSAYSVTESNAVDSDSNVDGVANIGDSSQTYTSAISQDGSHQNISEALHATYPNGRNYIKNITILSSFIDTTLTNYPYLLDIYDTDLRTDTLTNGWDIAFETISGGSLNFTNQVWDRTFNGTHAHLISWIEMPSISSSVDTVFYMYYSNYTNIVDPTDRPKVWDTYNTVYNFDEGSGTVVYDALGNYDGTLNNMGASSWSTGIVDEGISFNGGKQYPYTSDSQYTYNSTLVKLKDGKAQLAGGEKCIYNDGVTGLLNTTEEIVSSLNYLTLSMWFNSDDLSSNEYLYNAYAGGGRRPLFFGTHGNKLAVIVNDGSWQDSNVSLVTDTWYHGAYTFNGTKGGFEDGNLYLNGQNVNEIDIDWMHPLDRIDWIGHKFPGEVDEVSLWNVELTPAEILEIYNSGEPDNLTEHSRSSALWHWWKCGEDSTVDNFPDLSGHVDAVNATLYNLNASNIVYKTIQISSSKPSIESKYSYSFSESIQTFKEIATKTGSNEIRYQVSSDAGATWKFYNETSTAWEQRTNGQTDEWWYDNETNLATIINNNIATLGSSGNFRCKAFLYSADAVSTPYLDFVSISFNETMVTSSSSGNFTRTEAMSVGMWFFANESTDNYIISKKSSSYIGWSIYLEDGYLTYSLQNSGEINVRTTSTITASQWYYALIVYDGGSQASDVTIYLNGTSQSLTTVTDTLVAESTQNSFNLTIGMDVDQTYYFEGFIDEVELWQEEIASGEASSTFDIQSNPENTYSKDVEITGNTFVLDWEHQVTSVDTGKYAYNLSIYAFSNHTENFNIQMWNTTASDWGDVLATPITSSTTWINQTIVAGYITSTITWRYVSTNDTEDTVPELLSIDYAGVIGWNFSINLIETTITITDYEQGEGNISVEEIPLEILASSGKDYKIQIRGTDGVGNPVTNNYLFYDNDSVVTGALQLTTSWTDLFTVRSGDIEETLNFWMWLDVPFGVADITLTATVYIRIVEV